MKKMRTVALAWVAMATLGMAVGQTVAADGKADSSASQRNDKQKTADGKPAAAKRAMTFADLMAMRRVSDPQISPSGKWVLFSVTDVSLEKNTKVNHLWVVPLAGGDTKTTTEILSRAQNDASKVQSDASKGGGGGTEADSSAALRNDKQQEKQVTSNTGESFGRFSPDGKFVSYTGAPTKDDAVSRIVIATWDETTGTIGVGRTLQAVSGDADGAIWSPDSRHFLFTTQVYPECSVKGGKTTTGILTGGQNDALKTNDALNQNEALNRNEALKTAEPASWAEEDACDKAKDEAAEKSPVKGQVWDALFYRHWDHYTGLKRTHIIEADFSLDGANPRDLTPASAVGDAETPTWALGGPLGYAWAPDSKEIAYVTNLDPVPAASTNNDVFTLRLDEPGAKAVKVSTSPGSDDEPEYSPDGKWLAFRSQKQAGFESDKFDLVVIDRANGFQGNQTDGTLGGWVDEFSWSPDSSFIAFASGSKGEEAIYLAAASPEMAGLPCCIKVTSAGEFSDLRPDLKRQRLIATRMTMDSPSTIVTMPFSLKQDITQDLVAERDIKPLTHLNDPLISTLYLSPLETFWFAGAEGTKVQGFILRPPGFDPGKKYPVKFVMHGGPQTALGDSWSYRWNWELLAADGYVVVGINRRGSTGYGQKFVDEVSGDWGGRAYEDLMKGLDYAEATYPFIDKTRECALGASYGGFMADWILTHNDRFKCIVTHDGMVDPVSAYGTTEEMWFNEWEFRRPEDFPAGWDGFSGGYDPVAGMKADSSASLRNDKQNVLRNDERGGVGHPATPWRYAGLAADQDPFRKWSALRSIEKAKTPTLIIHSQRDYRLDVSQGFELFTALQRQGVPSRFLYFPDESHWVLKPQDSQLWYETVGDWCDRWTRTGKYAETK
jgi:dipeptidyl aminopeptidase/acylaminoacyl peptidase